MRAEKTPYFHKQGGSLTKLRGNPYQTPSSLRQR
jgi:hypothetical protein